MAGRGMCGIVICHGMSEYKLVSAIKSKLRLNLEVLGRAKGASSIQIDGLPEFFQNKTLKTKSALLKNYGNIEHKKKELEDFKIFTVMDVDDCSDISVRNNYLQGHISGLAQHDLKPYVVPIYCRENLEEVLTDISFPYVAATNKGKHHYIKVFDPNHGVLADEATIQRLRDKCAKSNKTNLEVLIDYCLAHQFKV